MPLTFAKAHPTATPVLAAPIDPLSFEPELHFAASLHTRAAKDAHFPDPAIGADRHLLDFLEFEFKLT